MYGGQTLRSKRASSQERMVPIPHGTNAKRIRLAGSPLHAVRRIAAGASFRTVRCAKRNHRLVRGVEAVHYVGKKGRPATLDSQVWTTGAENESSG